LRLVRVPTTVLAQNDVGVGVKNGIDLDGVKNLIGVFAPPFAVLADFNFLVTLPDREWRAGAAEAFKVALIKDAAFFGFLCREAGAVFRRDKAVMQHLIRRCAELHLDHIRTGGDPFEMGSARPLDFGHWSAHHLEMLSRHALQHGEAVAIGIALDTTYAARAGWVTSEVREALLSALTECGLAIWHPLLEARDADGALAILGGLERFREHLGGRLTLTFPDGPGRQREEHALDFAEIAASVDYLRNWQGLRSGQNLATHQHP
ncbi:MAG: 3-dehydroquinate synthase, partial [bacterium]